MHVDLTSVLNMETDACLSTMVRVDGIKTIDWDHVHVIQFHHLTLIIKTTYRRMIPRFTVDVDLSMQMLMLSNYA